MQLCQHEMAGFTSRRFLRTAINRGYVIGMPLTMKLVHGAGTRSTSTTSVSSMTAVLSHVAMAGKMAPHNLLS